ASPYCYIECATLQGAFILYDSDLRFITRCGLNLNGLVQQLQPIRRLYRVSQFEPNTHSAGHNRCMAAEAASERESWWVLKAQSGDREALNVLFRSVQDPLFRYVMSLVRDQHLAEDILQEVFIRIYRKLRWLREPEAFRAWTYQIASREAFRHLNRERRWSEQVRDEATLMAVPVDERGSEFPRELIETLPRLVGDLSPASRA